MAPQSSYDILALNVIIDRDTLMNREQTVSLTDHFRSFVEEKASEGRFATPSAVVEAGLRLLEKEEAKLALLRKAIEDGDTSGLAMPFDFQDLYDEIEADHLAAE